ncbi:MAG TPA: hypothetical protein VIM68_02635, partial [Thermoanaerobaculia bacterium]
PRASGLGCAPARFRVVCTHDFERRRQRTRGEASRRPLIKMQGVSHWLMLDKPDDFNRILDDFLREVDASEPRH